MRERENKMEKKIYVHKIHDEECCGGKGHHDHHEECCGGRGHHERHEHHEFRRPPRPERPERPHRHHKRRHHKKLTKMFTSKEALVEYVNEVGAKGHQVDVFKIDEDLYKIVEIVKENHEKEVKIEVEVE